jgi:phi LC3 family holin|nr:MAG TPA: holin [Caudoviricetes sp.]
MKINWKVRFKNPLFIAQLVMSVLVPIVGYAGITLADLTSWGALGTLLLNAISNPYVIGLVTISVYNAIIDPTTKGQKDSTKILNKK